MVSCSRRDDEHPLHVLAQLQLLENQPRHDGLASARIVGDEKANARRGQHVVIDRLNLVRQRINLRDAYRQLRVELVGQPQTVRLDEEKEFLFMQLIPKSLRSPEPLPPAPKNQSQVFKPLLSRGST